MQRKLAGILGVWLLASVALAAVDFWEEKEFTTWSDKEVVKMLTNSPWAKKVTVLLGGLNPESPGGFSGGAVPECGGAQFQGIRRFDATLAWSSALPLKQALVRAQTGQDAPIPAEGQQLLEQEEPFYTISVVGLPQQFAALMQMKDAVQASTMLKIKDREPIAPADIGFFRESEQTMQIVYQFPKSDAITMDDKEVEFISKLGPDNEIKKKFKLKDMMFAGQLAL
jgi:hypothetical protein